jgi:hypothetical protein
MAGARVTVDFRPGPHEWGFWDAEIQKVLARPPSTVDGQVDDDGAQMANLRVHFGGGIERVASVLSLSVLPRIRRDGEAKCPFR